VRERVIHHRMEEMKPLIGMRLGHPKELPLHFLDGILFEVGQKKEPLLGHRREGRGVIRTRAPARPGLSINGVVFQKGQKRVFERRQECCEF
jgi:hypothetical protein